MASDINYLKEIEEADKRITIKLGREKNYAKHFASIMQKSGLFSSSLRQEFTKFSEDLGEIRNKARELVKTKSWGEFQVIESKLKKLKKEDFKEIKEKIYKGYIYVKRFSDTLQRLIDEEDKLERAIIDFLHETSPVFIGAGGERKEIFIEHGESHEEFKKRIGERLKEISRVFKADLIELKKLFEIFNLAFKAGEKRADELGKALDKLLKEIDEKSENVNSVRMFSFGLVAVKIAFEDLVKAANKALEEEKKTELKLKFIENEERVRHNFLNFVERKIHQIFEQKWGKEGKELFERGELRLA